MALTITKQTNGSFLFEPTTGSKQGSSRPEVKLYGDDLIFLNHLGELIEKAKYDQITTVDGGTTVDDFESSEDVLDNLALLGMFATY